MDARGAHGSGGGSGRTHLRLRLGFLATMMALIGLGCKLMDSQAPVAVTPTPAEPPATQTATPAATAEAVPPGVAPDPGDSPVDAAGLTLVYTKAGALWRWQNGRAAAVPLSGAAYAPRLSLDGQMVAFLRPVDEFHVELWAANLDGSRERRLVSVADLDAIGGGKRDPGAVAINPYSFAWAPGDEPRLAFNTQQVYNGPGLALLDDLNLVNVETGQIRNLLLPGWGGEFAFSPDGSRVAISQAEKIFLANADGSDYHQVMAYPLVLTYSEYRFYAAPKWSPDGQFLRVAIPPEDALADPAAQTALWRIPADGAAPLQEGGVAAVPFFDTPVVYSPDLQRVAYLRDASAAGERSLHLATFDGRGDWEAARALMLQFAGWGPDGRRFAYIAEDSMETYVGSLDAPAQHLGAACSAAAGVRWVGPERLICTIQSPGAFDLILVDLNGGKLALDTVTGDLPAIDVAR